MDAVSVLLIGDAERDEFCSAREFLLAQTQLTVASGIAEGLADLAEAEIAPELIILAAAWPGRFTAGDIDRLRQAAPLARLLAMVGSWSEGETRTGQPWPGVQRIYAHQFVPRFGAELDRLAAGHSPNWSLPITATDEERLLAADALDTPKHNDGTIAIATRDFQTAESLTDACHSRDYKTLQLRCPATDDGPLTTDRLRAAIWDGGCQSDLDALHRFIQRLPDVPVVALLDFPRAADQQAAREAGAAAIVSKPFLLDDLFWQIDRLTAP
jgi:CheY-like chemotaxis protein